MKMPPAPPTQLSMPSNTRAPFSLVEAERQTVVQRAAGLRDAKRVDELRIAGDRVGRAEIVFGGVAQERDDVAYGGETEAGDERIRRGIRELVERALPERRAGRQQPDGFGVTVLPVGGGDPGRRVLVTHAHGESGSGLVERRRGIG